MGQFFNVVEEDKGFNKRQKPADRSPKLMQFKNNRKINLALIRYIGGKKPLPNEEVRPGEAVFLGWIKYYYLFWFYRIFF